MLTYIHYQIFSMNKAEFIIAMVVINILKHEEENITGIPE